MVEEPAQESNGAVDGEAGSPAEVITVTPAAREVVLQALAEEGDPERLALWVEVTGERGGSYAYDIYFQATAGAVAADHRQVDDAGLSVVVPATSVDRLRGARLDLDGGPEGGLVIVNPNTPPAVPGRPDISADLSGELAKRIIAVLEEHVNPGIAMHGGHAALVAVEEGTAFLRLSGGCQGCGMAKVTLSQGIEVALRDQIPELVGVVDVTDHASGTDPYFESAKK